MKSFGYYSFNDSRGSILNTCSKDSRERPLIVNCAGCFCTDAAFNTVNTDGRLDDYLMYITSGELVFYSGDEPLRVGEGSVVHIPAGSGYRYAFDGSGELCYYWVHFTGSEAATRLSEYGIASFPAVSRVHSVNHIPQRFQSIFDAYRKQDALRDRELSALLERLLISVARAVRHETDGVSTLSRSVGYLLVNYCDDIRIPELAAMEHLSVSRYNYLFKERFGVSPKQYVLRLRMYSASELLCSTDLSVKEIGAICGYGDSHFFSKIFKSYFGVSPTDYKLGKREEK